MSFTFGDINNSAVFPGPRLLKYSQFVHIITFFTTVELKITSLTNQSKK